MFEGLDQVEWGHIYGYYNLAIQTPDYLWKLAHDDPTERANGYSFITGVLNHQGDIYQATAKVVPFIVELLSSKDVQQKDMLLRILVGFVDSCDEHLLGQHHSISDLRYEFETYSNVQKGIALYTTFLRDEHVEIRKAAAELLGLLLDQHWHTRLPLYKALQSEQDNATSVVMIQSLGKLIPPLVQNRKRGKNIIKYYATSIERIAAQHADSDMRYAASIVWVDLEILREWAADKKEFPSYIIDTLTTAILQPMKVSEDIIALHKLSRLGVFALTAALQHSEMTSPVAHKLCREMLDLKFSRRNVHRPEDYWGAIYNGWNDYTRWNNLFNDGELRIYDYRQNDRSLFRQGTPLLHDQKVVLKTIVDCDLFWDVPTNLFSFFYGLWDDREALRKLVEES